jgi:hypothetical protein
MLGLSKVPRRFNSPSREQLDRAQLDELRKRLSAMPHHELAMFYRTTLNACRYEVRVPSPRMIQELVQAWKLLRKKLALRINLSEARIGEMSSSVR